MSTYYKHNSYGTWQHDRTKKWHQIDHIVAAASTAAFFTDVRGMPGLDFDSDHRLVRSSLRGMRRCKQPWGSRGGGIHGGFSLNKRMPELDLSKLGDETKVSSLNERPQWQIDNAHEVSRLPAQRKTAFQKRTQWLPGITGRCVSGTKSACKRYSTNGGQVKHRQYRRQLIVKNPTGNFKGISSCVVCCNMGDALQTS